MPAGLLAADLGPRVAAGFTTRIGGASLGPYAWNNLGTSVGEQAEIVQRNRDRLAAHLGSRLVWSRPVHGAQVALATETGVRPLTRGVGALDPDAPAVDALVSTTPGLGVAVLAADCVPVLMVAESGGQPLGVAAVHAGRRGVVLGVVRNAIEALAGEVTRVSGPTPAIRAVVGPSICGRCYEVPAAMREEVCAVAPAAWSETAWGTPALDLPAAVLAQITAAGAEASCSRECTREVDWLYSHRRDGVTGRFAGVIAIRHAGH